MSTFYSRLQVLGDTFHVAKRVAIATTVGIPASMLVIQRRIFFMVKRSSMNETATQVNVPTYSLGSF